MLLFITKNKRENRKGNVFISKVLVETSLDFNFLVKSTIKKDYGSDVTIRIVGVFKL